LPEYIAHRRIGGTAACVIANGGFFEKTPYSLWEELTGKREPEDLSWKLPVMLGKATEETNAKFYAHKSGFDVDYWGATLDLKVHAEHDFMVGQIDGAIVVPDRSIGLFEAKGSNERAKLVDLMTRYYPQIQHYFAVTGMNWGVLSVIFGNNRHESVEIEADPNFIEQLIERELAFWRCVVTDTPPEAISVEGISRKAMPLKKYDMSDSNSFATFAGTYLATQGAAKQFKEADRSLKNALPDDGIEAKGHGLVVKRSSNGSKRIYAQAKN